MPLALVTLIDETCSSCAARAARCPDADGDAPPSTGDAFNMPRSLSMCGHVVASEQSLVVEDIARDPRFANNPALQCQGLRFYAGAPLRDAEGHVYGSLCMLDIKPRSLSEREVRLLESMADDAMRLLPAAAEQAAPGTIGAAAASRRRRAAVVDGGAGRAAVGGRPARAPAGRMEAAATSAARCGCTGAGGRTARHSRCRSAPSRLHPPLRRAAAGRPHADGGRAAGGDGRRPAAAGACRPRPAALPQAQRRGAATRRRRYGSGAGAAAGRGSNTANASAPSCPTRPPRLRASAAIAEFMVLNSTWTRPAGLLPDGFQRGAQQPPAQPLPARAGVDRDADLGHQLAALRYSAAWARPTTRRPCIAPTRRWPPPPRLWRSGG